MINREIIPGINLVTSYPQCRPASMCHATILDDLRHNQFYLIDRNSKTNTIGRTEPGINCHQCGNTNHISLQVNQGPTTIARIDGCIGLNGIGDHWCIILIRSTTINLSATQSANNAMSHSLLKSQWVTDCQYILPCL